MNITKGLLRNKLKKNGYIFSSNLYTNVLPGYIAWHLFILSTLTILVGVLTFLCVYTDVIGTLCKQFLVNWFWITCRILHFSVQGSPQHLGLSLSSYFHLLVFDQYCPQLRRSAQGSGTENNFNIKIYVSRKRI